MFYTCQTARRLKKASASRSIGFRSASTLICRSSNEFSKKNSRKGKTKNLQRKITWWSYVFMHVEFLRECNKYGSSTQYWKCLELYVPIKMCTSIWIFVIILQLIGRKRSQSYFPSWVTVFVRTIKANKRKSLWNVWKQLSWRQDQVPFKIVAIESVTQDRTIKIR